MSSKKTQRVLVLGHKGMLGSMVLHHFAPQFDVVTIENRFDADDPRTFLTAARSCRADVVINAIGGIKQRIKDVHALLATNAYLPALLRSHLPVETLLIHPSTDCVFDGKTGFYASNHTYTAKDPYGLSKALGESILSSGNTLIIRCSIIGPEVPPRSSGLLGWFLSQPENAILQGFADHHWNGITTLEWARIAARLIARPSPSSQGLLVQPGTSHRHTKYDLLKLFSTHFRPDIRVERVLTGDPVDRTLQPTLVAPPLDDQLCELKREMQAIAQAIARRGAS